MADDAARPSPAPQLDRLRISILATPSDAGAVNALAALLVASRLYTEALAPLQRCLRLEPGDPSHPANLAATQVMLGRMAEAIGSARRALAIRREHVGAIACLASALQGARHHEAAERVVRALAIMDPTRPATAASLYRSARRRRDLAATVNAARRWAMLAPADLTARRALGAAAFDAGHGTAIGILTACLPDAGAVHLVPAHIRSVEAHSQRHGCPYLPIDRGQQVDCDGGRYPGAPPPFRTPDGFLARLDDVTFLPTSLALLAQDGGLLADLVSPYPRDSLGIDAAVAAAAPDGRVLLQLHASPAELETPGILLGSTDNFTHNVIDLLPRLEALEAAPQETSDLPLAICRGAPGGFRRLVELVLGRPIDFVELDDARPTTCRRLWVPSLTHRFNRYSPRAIDFIRARLPTRTRLDRPRGKRRLYLSRRGARYRRITNEADLAVLLQERGFEIVTAEAMTIEAQLEMFADAEFVILTTGGGNASTIFTPRGTRIVELSHERMLSRHVVTFASFLDHRYRRVLGPTMGTVGSLDFDWDFLIPPQALARAIDELSGELDAH
jgi:capsular polysaccharide biosynthesis protein/Flp pilus assembly protein TadD